MKTIIQQLINDSTPYLEIDSFSTTPGIYALFFIGKSFPLTAYSPKINEVIYIGKTESSQASRDRDTHFATGKTGSSTLRRSFGAMLRNRLKLNPIPRGKSDIKKGRTSHFKFDKASEIKLSDWMQKNLALSFYEHAGSMTALDQLETELIQELVPILNIDRKNPSNSHREAISALRKASSLVANDKKKKLTLKSRSF